MMAEIAHFPTIRAGQHVIRHEYRYSRIGRLEVMVGRAVTSDCPLFALYLKAPGRPNEILATVSGGDPQEVGAHIDHIWRAIESTLYLAREHADDLLADDVPQPWGAA